MESIVVVCLLIAGITMLVTSLFPMQPQHPPVVYVYVEPDSYQQRSGCLIPVFVMICIVLFIIAIR